MINFRTKYPEDALAMSATIHNAMEKAREDLAAQIKADATSAILKTDAAELTEGEKFALAFYAGIPMRHGDMRERDASKFTMTTIPCSFFHDGQKWIVASQEKDWPRP